MKTLRVFVEELIVSLGFEITGGLWLVWLASALLLLISAISFLAVIVSRYRKDYLDRWEKAFHLKIEALLLDLIYGDYPSYEAWKEAMAFERFEKKYLSKKRGKKLFIRTLAILRSRLNGEDAMRLAELYRKTGLYKMSLSLLQSSRWHVKAAGIRELGALNYVEAIAVIRPFTNHPHEELRSIAQLALIQLDDTDPLGFLDKLDKPISLNAMIRLHGAMLQKTSLDITSFDRWLANPHADVVLFATKMAGLFNAAADETRLFQLASHHHLAIARAAIISLEQLGAQSSLTELIAVLAHAPTALQLQLIQSLGNLGFHDENYLQVWLHSPSFEIVKASFEILAANQPPDIIASVLEKQTSGMHLNEIRSQREQFIQKQLP